MLGIITDRLKEKNGQVYFVFEGLAGEEMIFLCVSLNLPLPCWIRYLQVRHKGDQLAMTGRGIPACLVKHLSLLDMILTASEGDQIVQVSDPKMQYSANKNSLKTGTQSSCKVRKKNLWF